MKAIDIGDRVKAPGWAEAGVVMAVMEPWAKVIFTPARGGSGKIALFKIDELEKQDDS